MGEQPQEKSSNNSMGNAPATAASNLEQMIASSLGLAAQNAVLAQQQANILHQAMTTLGIEQLYAVGSSSSKINDSFEKTIEQLKQIMELSKSSSKPEDSEKNTN